MNRHLIVPYCEKCQLNAVHSGRCLVCPLCAQILEDFSPPRKLEVAKKKLQWERTPEVVRLRFRNVVIARAELEICSQVVSQDGSLDLSHVAQGARYIIEDLPIVEVLGLGPAAHSALFLALADAEKALRTIVSIRLEL